ncbi:MAG: diaminopimelate epimerase [Bacillota bacterium]|nr:diaminopimelate epimerase [Bacillota bacterium]
MKLNFIKVNPSENMTVFIMDPVPRDKHVEISNKIMNYNNIHAEQVGFVEKGTNNGQIRLQMMGGEFCGNASRALASILVLKKHSSVDHSNNKAIVPLEVSGTEDIHHLEVIPTESETTFISSIEMPLHSNIEDICINYNDYVYKASLITFSGIMHIIVDDENIASKHDFFINAINTLEYLDYDALGIMFLNEEKSFITPLVYVKATDSIVWERSCGSGTAAVGIFLSYKNKKNIDAVITQPGGELKIITKWENNAVTEATLSGIVSIVAEGVLYLD